MIEFALATHLKSRPVVTAAVGSRIYADKAPQDAARPYIVYEIAGGERHYHSTGSSGLMESEISLRLHESTYLKARQLYEIIRNEIDGFRGTWGSVAIDRATLGPPVNGTAAPSDADEVGEPAVRTVVEVFHQESRPELS